MTQDIKITRALTVGIAVNEVCFCKPQGRELEPITDDSLRKDVLQELVKVGFEISNLKTKAAACKFASVIVDSSGISKKVLGERDEKDIKELKSNLVHSLRNYTEHELATEAAASCRSTAWKEAQDALSGEHLSSVLMGKSQLPIYHRKLNFPLHNQQYTIVQKAADYYLCASIFTPDSAKRFGSTTWLAFKIRIKERDYPRVSDELNKVISKEYKPGTTRLIREMHRGFAKWTARIIVTHIPQINKPVNQNNIIGIDLGFIWPAVVSLIKNGKQAEWTKQFGNGKSITVQRLSIQNRIRSVNRELRSRDVHLTPERKNALVARKHSLRKQEKFFIRTAMQKIAKGVADFSLKNSAGTWVLEKLEVGELKIAGLKEGDKEWLSRNWSPAILIDALKWNAKKIGARVIEVDPRGTSRTCFQCGHNEPGNRKSQSEFSCLSCGFKDNADRNAAKNIAKRGRDSLETKKSV